MKFSFCALLITLIALATSVKAYDILERRIPLSECYMTNCSAVNILSNTGRYQLRHGGYRDDVYICNMENMGAIWVKYKCFYMNEVM